MEDDMACSLLRLPDFSGVTIIPLRPDPSPADYRAAVELAKTEAASHFGEPMLLSWYDRDLDFEAPQHVSECHQDSATPGYVAYGLSHGARLMIDIESGRFVFFFRDAIQF